MPDEVTGDRDSDESSSSGEPAIDPRYDPAFQRGFSGEVASAPRGQSTLRRTAAVNPPRSAPAIVEPSRVDAGGTAAQPAQPVIAPERVDAVSDAGSAAATAPPSALTPPVAATPRELARNPFILALAALAAVLVIAGAVWAFQGFSSIVKNGGTRNEVEFWAAQTMSFGAPLAIIAGLVLAGLLLAQFGRAWQRAQRD